MFNQQTGRRSDQLNYKHQEEEENNFLSHKNAVSLLLTVFCSKIPRLPTFCAYAGGAFSMAFKPRIQIV